MKISRVVLGLFVAPLLAPLVFYVISFLGTAVTQGDGGSIPINIAYLYGAPIAYLIAIVLGLPMLALMQRLHRTSLADAAIAGLLLGWFPFVVPLLIPSDFRQEYTVSDYVLALAQSLADAQERRLRWPRTAVFMIEQTPNPSIELTYSGKLRLAANRSSCQTLGASDVD